MIDISILKDLNAFNGVIYKDEPHEYVFEGKLLKSATTIIGEFEYEFDSEKIAGECIARHTNIFNTYHKNKTPEQLDAMVDWQKNKIRYANRTVEGVCAEWDLNNRKATTMGSIAHAFMEQLTMNKVLADIHVDIDLDLIKDKVRIAKTLMYRFWQKFGGSRYLTVSPEFVLFDSELELSGMIDYLGYDVVDQCFVILDWKTNKEIKKESYNHKKLKGIFSHLDDCEFNIYSLQLSLYKTIIEKHTNFKIGALRIIHFDTINNKTVEYNIPYLEKEMEMLFEYRRRTLDTQQVA